MSKHPFEIVYGDPSDSQTRTEISQAILLCEAREKLSRAKLGAIGGNAPGFLAMAPDTFAMKQKLGVQLAMLSLTQFIDQVRGIDDAAAKRDVDRVRAMKISIRDVTVDDLDLQSRYYLALRQLVQEEGLDALSLQDWPELRSNPGQWPYLAMSRLVDEQIPIGKEGDADGAILCLIAKHLQMGPGFITD